MIDYYTQHIKQCELRYNLDHCRHFSRNKINQCPCFSLSIIEKRNSCHYGQSVDCAQLGLMFLQGQGGRPNKEAAVRFDTKAAEQGYAPSQYDLGRMHYQGDGIAQNKDLAVQWFNKAAAQGYAPAIHALGELGLKHN